MRASIRVAIALLVAVFVASACGGSGTGGAKPNVKVGSTNFYEQGILGELYAQILENSGYTVERKFNLGNREIVQPALESGQIDIDAEYLATLLSFVDKNAKASTDPKQTAKDLQTALSAKKLTVLDAAAATDQNGFVVTKDTAAKYNLKKLSDLTSCSRTTSTCSSRTTSRPSFAMISWRRMTARSRSCSTASARSSRRTS